MTRGFPRFTAKQTANPEENLSHDGWPLAYCVLYSFVALWELLPDGATCVVLVVLGAGAELVDAFGVSLPVDVDFEESVFGGAADFVGEFVTASSSGFVEVSSSLVPSVGAGEVGAGAVDSLSSGVSEPSGLVEPLGLSDSLGLVDPSGLCEPSGDCEPLGDSLSLGDGRFVSDGVGFGFGFGMTGVSSSGTITSGSGPLGARSGVWEPLPFGAVPALTVRRCELIIA